MEVFVDSYLDASEQGAIILESLGLGVEEIKHCVILLVLSY